MKWLFPLPWVRGADLDIKLSGLWYPLCWEEREEEEEEEEEEGEEEDAHSRTNVETYLLVSGMPCRFLVVFRSPPMILITSRLWHLITFSHSSFACLLPSRSVCLFFCLAFLSLQF